MITGIYIVVIRYVCSSWAGTVVAHLNRNISISEVKQGFSNVHRGNACRTGVIPSDVKQWHVYCFLTVLMNVLFTSGSVPTWWSKGIIILFVCFVALRPKSTAMVIAGRSVHLITLFPGQA